VSNNSRTFISEHQKAKTFLVFYCVNDKILKRKSEGPYTDINKAYSTMNEYLINGICSWVVSYNE